jgi:2-keto-3-deoxy-L-rhamnonate aldolase RhmA
MVSQKDAAQGVEGVDAVLPGRFDLSADTAEVHEGVIPDCSQRVAQAFQPVQAQAKACGYRK